LGLSLFGERGYKEQCFVFFTYRPGILMWGTSKTSFYSFPQDEVSLFNKASCLLSPTTERTRLRTVKE